MTNSRKMTITRNIRLLLLLTWMLLIFAYSARPADVSTQDSHAIGNLVADMIQGCTGAKWSVDEKLIFVMNIDFYVRKAAHLTEYAILGILLISYLQCVTTNLHRQTSYIYALPIGILYAITDELHQSFVPGRACQFRDVVIDSIGVAIGLAVFWCWQTCKPSRKHRTSAADL